MRVLQAVVIAAGFGLLALAFCEIAAARQCRDRGQAIKRFLSAVPRARMSYAVQQLFDKEMNEASGFDEDATRIEREAVGIGVIGATLITVAVVDVVILRGRRVSAQANQRTQRTRDEHSVTC